MMLFNHRIDKFMGALAFVLFLCVGGSPGKVAAQVGAVHPTRSDYCRTARPPLPPTGEMTLCAQFPNLNEETAYKVIGTGPGSISYASVERPVGSNGWSGKQLIINGTLHIDVNNFFVSCVVKMGPGAKIIVDEGKLSLSLYSKFFACGQMWEGFILRPSSTGVLASSQIEDANIAENVHPLARTSLIGTRFNRNYIGVYSNMENLPNASLVTGSFLGNEFTITSDLNTPYPGQMFGPFHCGVYLNNASAHLVGASASPNRFSRLTDGLVSKAPSNSTTVVLGHATFTDHYNEGVWAMGGILVVPAESPCKFTDNFYAGILAQEAELDINGCTFEGDKDQLYGILSEMSRPKTRRGISGNAFNLSGEGAHLSAMFVERAGGGGNRIWIENNILNIAGNANGILVSSLPGATGNCSVSANFVNYTGSASQCDGIHVTGGSADGYEISGNTIDVMLDGGVGINVRGIVFDLCTGSGHLISGNHVFNSGPLGKAADQAISVVSAPNAMVCLNEVDDSFEGIVLFGMNNPTSFEVNRMHSHNFSFILDGNAVSPPNIGTQFRKGNYWEPGAHTARAALSSAPSLVSRFFMHSLNIEFFPTSVDPPDWFTGDIGSLAATCMPGAAAEDGTTDLDDQIADGTYFSTTTPPLVAWELKRNLYYKLLRDPGYGQGNPNYAAFQQANANTTVGKFAKVAHDMYTASAVPAAISQQVDDLDARSAAFLLQLEQLEAGQPPAVEPYDQDNTFLAAKRALLDSINLVGSQRAALTNQLAADFAVKLALVRADNQAIVTAHGFEANQKALNEIAIKMALREAYTVADLATVQGIAAQSESAAGTTQWQANAMLPPCQRAPWPESGRDKTEDRDAAPARPDVARNKLFEVSPNPASDLATVRFGQPFSGTLVLMDARANTVQQFELSASTQWNVETKSLPHGIYYLQAYDQQGRPTTLKIVVTH